MCGCVCGGGSFRWDRKNRGPVSWKVWHDDEDPSLLKTHKHRAVAEMLQPFAGNNALRQYEWNFFEWDLKKYIN